LTPHAAPPLYHRQATAYRTSAHPNETFEGTPLDIALRDCGIGAFAIVGVALEIGIEPTVRHATDLGYIPVVVTDACGSRDQAAAARSLATLAFASGSLQTDSATLATALGYGRDA